MPSDAKLLNTDFAEHEVDTRRTNLTRFALFFPEKRTFFLEGADIFSFGPGLSRVGPDQSPDVSSKESKCPLSRAARSTAVSSCTTITFVRSSIDGSSSRINSSSSCSTRGDYDPSTEP
jgi:uncharacterized protein DUF5916